MPASEHLVHFGLHERRRQARGSGGQSQLGDRGAGAGAQRLVERDAHALARPGVPDGPLAHRVARILKDQRLGAHLHALGLIGAFGHVRALALLGVDRRDGAILALDQIHPGDDTERLGGERHRAGREVWPVVSLVGGRQLAAAGIDAHMHAPPLLGVARVRPFSVHPFQEGQPRAVHPLVDHAHRHERRVLGRRRGGELQGELGWRWRLGHGRRSATFATAIVGHGRGCHRNPRLAGMSRGFHPWTRGCRRAFRRSLGTGRKAALRSWLSFGHARSCGCGLRHSLGFRRRLCLRSGCNMRRSALRHRSNPIVQSATLSAGSKR
jgi:hypothetical protein